MTKEVHSFQAETQQLMSLMVHSLYSNKEIFLRELISNASDAVDKLRFEEITNHNLLKSEKENSVLITADKEKHTLTIEDNGIGMNKEEIMNNLGTIANSGTKKFLEKLSEQDKKDSNLIGQFGVGFYSAFMVASKITVESRSAHGGSAYKWISIGDGSYTLEECEKETRGTKIVLELKEDEKEFSEDWRIRGVVKKYSDYVTYPIFLSELKEGKTEETRLNKSTPVWARNKRENKPEDYQELYKQISMDWREPLLWEHMSVEGLVPFNAVVYVPSEAPFDLYTRDNHGLHLYVKRVSISEKCKELLPEYLRFVAGVVETDELPLNVSREILQQNNKLPQIKKQVVKKVLTALQNLSQNDNEKYLNFYKVFGAVLKEGFHFDHEQHEFLSELVRFKSTKTGKEGYVSFKEYIERRADSQRDIYYLTGPSFEAVERSPHLEALTSRGIEVLFLIDPIDEWFIMSYAKHGEYNLKPINKGDIDLSGVGKESEEEKKREEAPVEQLVGLIDLFRTKLSDDIKEVKVSKRLRESACCLVADEHGMSAHMERIMKATGQSFGDNKRILEINPSHALIKNLAERKNTGADENTLNEWVEVLYETALLSEGSPVKNPGTFAKRLTKIMEVASGK
ncbi:molecular chaperone HtpG [Fluviispira multicolorata]|uniref:Chaperone protein HtpG n=1 Tax=Fluviispira multicolorata TaxID=2654512 RepID=A0A833JCY0_9BACT|nr:molecular chaperone HtpG [Fluviispira multicolorata]KAB8030615.1 molecular chaperone HtpG [Fluviispira multicolorata]